MNEEQNITRLGQILNNSKNLSFGKITATEKEELSELSLKMPADLEIMKDGSRSQVGRYQLANGRKIVLKYYFPKNLLKKIGNRFRQTRCRQSWIAAHGLTYLGIPTPAPLAIAEHYQVGFFNCMSFLATDLAPGIRLNEVKTDRFTKLIPSLSSAFSTMAQYHITHGDLKASNMIVSNEDQISFIDLDATRFQLRKKNWDKARAYDEERFLRNWKHDTSAAELLKTCFKENHG